MTSNVRVLRNSNGATQAGVVAKLGAGAMSRSTLESDHPYSDPRWGDGDRDPYRLPSKETGKRKK